MENETRKPKSKKKPVKNDDSAISPEINDLEVAKKMIKIYQSAVDRKLRFDLSFESVKKLLSYPTCYYTNKKFEDDGPFQRSFDRVDSSKGYVEGNVVACTVDINGKKSNLSFDEIECLYKKLSPSTKKKPQAMEILNVSINEDQPSADTNI
jgi:hypothetical protein